MATKKEKHIKLLFNGISKFRILPLINLDNEGLKAIGLRPNSVKVGNEYVEEDRLYTYPETMPEKDTDGNMVKDENDKYIFNETGNTELLYHFYVQLDKNWVDEQFILNVKDDVDTQLNELVKQYNVKSIDELGDVPKANILTKYLSKTKALYDEIQKKIFTLPDNSDRYNNKLVLVERQASKGDVTKNKSKKYEYIDTDGNSAWIDISIEPGTENFTNDRINIDTCRRTYKGEKIGGLLDTLSVLSGDIRYFQPFDYAKHIKGNYKDIQSELKEIIADEDYEGFWGCLFISINPNNGNTYQKLYTQALAPHARLVVDALNKVEKRNPKYLPDGIYTTDAKLVNIPENDLTMGVPKQDKVTTQVTPEESPF